MGSASRARGVPYLRFDTFGRSKSGLTDVVDIYSAHGGGHLGHIAWDAHWRQYVLRQRAFDVGDLDVIWSDGCLREVADKITAMNAQHRDEARIRRAHRAQEE